MRSSFYMVRFVLSALSEDVFCLRASSASSRPSTSLKSDAMVFFPVIFPNIQMKSQITIGSKSVINRSKRKITPCPSKLKMAAIKVATANKTRITMPAIAAIRCFFEYMLFPFCAYGQLPLLYSMNGEKTRKKWHIKMVCGTINKICACSGG